MTNRAGLTAGLIQLQVGGVIQDAKGAFRYGLGVPQLKAHYGPTGELQGYSSVPTTAFIEGMITDRGTLDVAALMNLGGVVGGSMRNVAAAVASLGGSIGRSGRVQLTVTLSLANGKTIALSNAGWAGEGTGSTEEAEIPVRWEGGPCIEIM